MSFDWTLLVYMAAQDFKTDPDTGINYAQANLRALLNSPSSPNVAIAIELFTGDAKTTKRFVRKGTAPGDSVAARRKVGSTDRFDAPDAGAIRDFLQWGIQECPSARTAVIIWGHGDGVENWQQALKQPTRTLHLPMPPAATIFGSKNKTGLSIPEVASALDVGHPFDLVGLDACFMAMLEIAYELAPRAGVLVGSELVSPEEGWAYDAILSALAANTTMDATALGSAIVTSFHDRYDGSRRHPETTIAAIDQAKLAAAVEGPFVDFVTALKGNGAQQKAVIDQRQRSDGGVYNNGIYLDVGFFGQVGATVPTAQPVLDAIEASLTRETTGKATTDGLRALSFYYPLDPSESSNLKLYSALRFSQKTGWADLLATLIQGMPASRRPGP